MRSYVVFFSGFCAILVQIMGQLPHQRVRRYAVGALDIITNNEKPIHADVKAESVTSEHGDSTTTASFSTTAETLPYPRVRRDAAGALDIVNNNEKPIHAEVKVEQVEEASASSTIASTSENDNSSASSNITTEKPCPKPYVPSSIEMGVVFQLPQLQSPVQNVTAPNDTTVTPPKDVTNIPEELYSSKSLRKSWPLPSRLDLVRSVSRIVTLTVVLVSGAIEVFSLLQHLLKPYGYF